MSGSIDDVQRSLRRLLAEGLGDTWTIRLERMEVPDDDRPVAFVEGAGPTVTPLAPRMTIPQGDYDKLKPFTVSTYPVLGATPHESRKVAFDLEHTLARIFEVGLDMAHSRPGVVALYDYSAVALAGQAGPATPFGYAHSDDVSVRATQDMADDRRWTVTCDLRLTWRVGGRVLPLQPFVDRLEGVYRTGPDPSP
jgi:hypothetical protein